MTELVSFRTQFCIVMHLLNPGMKNCCDVLCHSYVHPASIYRILPQIRPHPNRIQIYWIRPRSTKFTGYPAGSRSGSGPPLQEACNFIWNMFCYCSFADQLSVCSREIMCYIDSVGTTYHDLRQFVEAIDISAYFDCSFAGNQPTDVTTASLSNNDYQSSGLLFVPWKSDNNNNDVRSHWDPSVGPKNIKLLYITAHHVLIPAVLQFILADSNCNFCGTPAWPRVTGKVWSLNINWKQW